MLSLVLPRRHRRPASWRRPIGPGLAALALLGASAGATANTPPTVNDGPAALERWLGLAEASLRDGELQMAESHYRQALLEGSMILGAFELAEGRAAEAKRHFERATASTADAAPAFKRLALVHLRLREPDAALVLLTRVLARAPHDREGRQLLAQALVAIGQPEQAVQELEEGHALDPADTELAFALASGYLRLGKPDAAERLFAQVRRERPLPQTHVLIGRTYRDFKQFERAEKELRAALALDPKVRRAHYYLGMIDVTDRGAAGLQDAIGEFRQELALGPDDPLINLRLGMALVEAQRPSEALPLLELAARSEPPEPDALLYLGRCRLSLGHTADAVAALRRALDLFKLPPVDEPRLGSTHYQLATALRRSGDTAGATTHFAEAERTSARRVKTSEEQLSRYLTAVPDKDALAATVAPLVGASELDGLRPEERAALAKRARESVARACLNLGVIHAQASRFDRAALSFTLAAEADPGFPQVQRSLGVAHFNAGAFEKAVEPLGRALEADPGDITLRRLLALARFNSDGFVEAAALLKDDPGRDSDPALQFTYGAALVRSGRAAEAESIFARLISGHAESAEVHVVLGQAHAAQGDYDQAVASLRRALELKPDVAEANATLGVMYLKQGKLDEAEAALRAEIQAHPGDLRSQNHLATVLDLRGRPDEAVPLLRTVLRTRPSFADARYLLGKILLAQGLGPEALEHLEAAARLAPEDANVRYQLGKAYQKAGRDAAAAEQFEIFRTLKDKKRGDTP